jgi:hypothetical protein
VFSGLSGNELRHTFTDPPLRELTPGCKLT